MIYRNNFPNPNKRFSAGTIIMVKNSIARASFIKHTIMVPGYLHMLEVTPKDPDYPPYRVINFYGQQTLDGRLAQIGCIESLDPVKYTFLGGDFNFKDKPNQTTGRYTEPPARFMTAWNRTLEKHALCIAEFAPSKLGKKTLKLCNTTGGPRRGGQASDGARG